MRYTQSACDLTFLLMLVDQVLQSISGLCIKPATFCKINCPSPKLYSATIKINQNTCEKIKSTSN